MAALPDLAENAQVRGLFVVVVVRHRDKGPVGQSSTPKNKCLHGARRSPISIEKGVHGSEVIVQSHCLHQRIVVVEFSLGGLKKSGKRLFAERSSLRAPVRGNAKGHVVVAPAKYAGRAMVLIASGHQTTMNLAHKIGGNRPVGGQFSNPAVSQHGRARLPLRSRSEFLRRNVRSDRLFKLPLRKLRALNPAGAGYFTLQLQFLQRLHPALLIGQSSQRLHRRFGFNKRSHNGACIVTNPALWKLIANHLFPDSCPTSF